MNIHIFVCYVMRFLVDQILYQLSFGKKGKAVKIAEHSHSNTIT